LRFYPYSAHWAPDRRLVLGFTGKSGADNATEEKRQLPDRPQDPLLLPAKRRREFEALIGEAALLDFLLEMSIRRSVKAS